MRSVPDSAAAPILVGAAVLESASLRDEIGGDGDVAMALLGTVLRGQGFCVESIKRSAFVQRSDRRVRLAHSGLLLEADRREGLIERRGVAIADPQAIDLSRDGVATDAE